jgi:hypothetical protein
MFNKTERQTNGSFRDLICTYLLMHEIHFDEQLDGQILIQQNVSHSKQLLTFEWIYWTTWLILFFGETKRTNYCVFEIDNCFFYRLSSSLFRAFGLNKPMDTILKQYIDVAIWHWLKLVQNIWTCSRKMNKTIGEFERARILLFEISIYFVVNHRNLRLLFLLYCSEIFIDDVANDSFTFSHFNAKCNTDKLKSVSEFFFDKKILNIPLKYNNGIS